MRSRKWKKEKRITQAEAVAEVISQLWLLYR